MSQAARGFVGREADLGRLDEAFAAVTAGKGGVALVEAPGGMGSSRLIDEALRRLADPGRGGFGPAPLILRSDALPAWRGRPYEPLRLALERELRSRSATDAESLLAPAADVLLPILPRAAAHAGMTPRATPAEHRFDRTLEAIRGLLGRLAGERPLVLAVEDLHVMDAATRSTMAFLARTLGDRPILLIGSYRPEALVLGHPLRSTLEAIEDGASALLRLQLAPMDRPELSALIEVHEGERPSAPLLLLVAERSAGSPLVAEEVLAARRELSTASLAVPLDQLVRARAARRTVACRHVLQALAVADGPLRLGELAGILEATRARPGSAPVRSIVDRRADAEPRAHAVPQAQAARAHAVPPPHPERHPAGRGFPDPWADVRGSLAEAVEAGFVLAVETPPTTEGRDRAYRIRHELIADALAADLLPAERRRMHLGIAQALTALPAEAERHWVLGHDTASARVAAIEAATAAEAVGAGADALAHMELAIELDPEADAGPGRPLLLRAADAAAAAHDLQRAAAYVEASLATPAVAGDRAVAAAHWEQLGNLRWEAGDRDGAMAACERARSLLTGGARLDRARILARIAQVHMLAGSFRLATRLGREALALAAGDDDAARAIAAHVSTTLGVIDGWSGRTERAVERLTEALAVASELGRVDDAFRARANLATVLALEGRRSEAVEVAMAGIAAAERDGLEDLHGNLLRGQVIDFLFFAGRWQEARDVAARALSWISSGHPYVSAASNFLLVDAEMTYGAAAPRVLGRLLLELETVADAQAAIIAYLAAASIALWRGDAADARRAVEAAWGRIRSTEDWVLQGRTASIALAVAADLAAGARDRRDMGTLAEVRGWGDGVLAEAERLIAAADVEPGAYSRREADAELTTARAHRGRLAGRDDPAAWASIAATWAGLGRRYDEALACWRQSAALLDSTTASGQRREGRELAREPLLRAARSAADLGAVPLLKAVHDLADRARVTLPAELFAALRAPDRPPSDEATRPELGRAAGSSARTGGPAIRRPPVATETFGLSGRERGVLAEIVAGRTNREIGERLFISEKTVGVHVGNILAKLGVAGRVEAATVAIRLGLVDDTAEAARRPGRLGRESR